MKIIGRRPVIATAGVVAVLIYVVLCILGIDIIHWLDKLEPYNVDELLIPLLVILIGIILELAFVQYRRRLELHAERLRVLKATMYTVHDIVNNFLSNIQFFEMEAEKGALSTESKQELDTLIRETAEKLKVLGDIDVIREKEIAGRSFIDFEQSAKLKKAVSGI